MCASIFFFPTAVNLPGLNEKQVPEPSLAQRKHQNSVIAATLLIIHQALPHEVIYSVLHSVHLIYCHVTHELNTAPSTVAVLCKSMVFSFCRAAVISAPLCTATILTLNKLLLKEADSYTTLCSYGDTSVNIATEQKICCHPKLLMFSSSYERL